MVGVLLNHLLGLDVIGNWALATSQRMTGSPQEGHTPELKEDLA